MQVALTGHPGIRGDDDTLTDATGIGRLGRLSFAYLVLRRHRPVPREELADILWGDELPRTWDTSLRVTMSRLRTWLAAAGLDRAESLTSAFGCYQLHLPADTRVDVEEAAAAVADARRALAAGEAATARALAARAAGTAAQEFLPGASGPWVEREQEEWRGLRGNALELLAEASLTDGDAKAALAAAEAAVAVDPLRESAHVLVMRALAELGNRAEALRAYERLRRLLAEEVGISPSRTTEAAYLSLLRDDEEPVPKAPPPHAAARTLPTPLTSFVGRDSDLAEVMRRLRASRLVTVVGTGGLGKTRLALEAASQLAGEFADGAAFLSLGEVGDASAVAARALDVLGVAEEPGRPPVDSLAAGLAGRHLLLVVDNCEHVIEVASDLVAAVLGAAPRLVVLATSREALRVPGEVVWPLSPMTPEEAGRLFRERAAAAAPRLSVDSVDSVDSAEPDMVAAVCRRLDGIPLAIELAAARVGMLSLPEIAGRLDDRFALLTGGARTAPTRHQTLRHALDWSYDALPADERHLFHCASVFPGAFTLDALAEVAGLRDPNAVAGLRGPNAVAGLRGPNAVAGLAPAVALDGLASLVARSLVVAVPAPGQPTRYRMLETLRAYAAEHLEASGDGPAARARLAAWAAGVAEKAEARLDGPEQAAWLDRLDAEHANLLAALDAPPGVDRLRLATALGRFWEMRGHLQEGRERLRAVLADAEDAPPLLRARAENAAALLAQRQGDYAAARSRLEQSLSLRRRAGDRLGVAVALHGLGNLAALSHDPVEARRLYGEALAIGQELGATGLVAAALDNLGWVAHAEGDFAAARVSYERALAVRRDAGDQHGIALVLSHLGDLAYQQGDYAGAEALHSESLQLRTELGDQAGRADSLATLGHLAMAECLAGARARLAESLAIRRELGDRAALPNALANLADLALLTGDLEEARVHLKEAAAVAAGGRDPAVLAHVLVHHGRLALAEGRPDLAARRYVEAREAAGHLAADSVTAEWLEGAGAAVAAAGDPAAGASLLGAAHALRETVGAPVPPYERPAHERDLASVRAALDEAAFTAAWETALTTALDEVVDAAHQALTRASTPPGG